MDDNKTIFDIELEKITSRDYSQYNLTELLELLEQQQITLNKSADIMKDLSKRLRKSRADAVLSQFNSVGLLMMLGLYLSGIDFLLSILLGAVVVCIGVALNIIESKKINSQ